MTDRFADAEEAPKPRSIRAWVAVILIVGVFLAFRWSGSAPHRLTGVVESTGTVSVARVQGSTREEAAVRLADGTLVFAYVVEGGPLSKGDQVFLLEQDRLLGGPVYQVVGKATAK